MVSPDFVDRNALAASLVALGYVANPRDWALGETIFVSHPRYARTSNEIVVYERAVYLRREGSCWLVLDLADKRPEPLASLESWDEVLAYLELRFRP